MFCNLDQATGTQDLADGKSMSDLLAKGAAAGSGLGSTAFDGQLAKLGSFRDMKDQVDTAEDATAAIEQDNDKAEDATATTATAKQHQQRGQKRKAGSEYAPWFERELKISAAVKAQRTSMEEHRVNLEKVHDKVLGMIDTVRAIPALTQTCSVELKIACIRGQAVGLVLGLEDWTCPSNNQPSPTLSSPGSKAGETPSSVKPDAGATTVSMNDAPALPAGGPPSGGGPPAEGVPKAEGGPTVEGVALAEGVAPAEGDPPAAVVESPAKDGKPLEPEKN